MERKLKIIRCGLQTKKANCKHCASIVATDLADSYPADDIYFNICSDSEVLEKHGKACEYAIPREIVAYDL